jgi:hypothetical protein
MALPSAESMADTVPGVIVMVPASTVIASGEVTSSGTVIQAERMSLLALEEDDGSATCTFATTMSQSTIRMYSTIFRGRATFGRSGQ